MGLEVGQAARLQPHPVRDRARHAEQLGAERMQVDRVAVAGDLGVAAADVAGDVPDRHRWPRRGAASARSPLPLPLRLASDEDFSAAAAAAGVHPMQIGARALPRELVADADLGAHVELGATLVRAQPLRPHAQVEPLLGEQRPLLVDAVGDVHEADGSEREVRAGHERHLQREA